MSKYYHGDQMSKYYHCAVCEQIIPKEDIVHIQNTRSSTRAWKECPTCGSKVLPVSNDNFDVQEMVEFQFHKALQ
jgi:DNA-directed RNA polymerase subunit RPC12/RpoP